MRRQRPRHEPGLIVTVSAGAGGSYPVTELRISSYKNTRLCYIPDHVIVRNVGQMLHGDQPAEEHDQALRGRITYSLRCWSNTPKPCVWSAIAASST